MNGWQALQAKFFTQRKSSYSEWFYPITDSVPIFGVETPHLLLSSVFTGSLSSWNALDKTCYALIYHRGETGRWNCSWEYYSHDKSIFHRKVVCLIFVPFKGWPFELLFKKAWNSFGLSHCTAVREMKCLIIPSNCIHFTWSLAAAVFNKCCKHIQDSPALYMTILMKCAYIKEELHKKKACVSCSPRMFQGIGAVILHVRGAFSAQRSVSKICDSQVTGCLLTDFFLWCTYTCDWQACHQHGEKSDTHLREDESHHSCCYSDAVIFLFSAYPDTSERQKW